MSYSRRDIRGGAVQTTLTAGISAGDTSCAIAASTGWPDGSVNGSFYVVIDPGTASEEKVLCSTRSTLTVNFTTRGADGTSASAHASGAVIYPIGAAVDFDEANYAVSQTVGKIAAAGDLLVGSAANTLAKLAKGSDSTVLVTDSGGTVGWATVTSAMITDTTIATGDIAANAVTNAKLAGMSRGTIKVGNSSGAASDLALGTSGYVLTSDGTDAVWAASGGGWTTVTKGSNESVSSSETLQADDALIFTAANGTPYEFEFAIVFASASGDPNTGIKVALGEDSTFRGSAYLTGPQGGSPYSAIEYNIGCDRATAGTFTSSSTKRVITGRGGYTGAGGTFAVMWAQYTSNGTATIVYSGSLLRYRALT